jgi:hypothetical protein
MSTNFYVDVADAGDELHFGKSSGGWKFHIRQYPEHNLFTLYDWLSLLASPCNTIRNEYGDTVTVQELLNTVMHRTVSLSSTPHPGKTAGEGETWDYNCYEFC